MSAGDDDYVEAEAVEPPCMTELQERYIDRLLAIRQHTVGDVECVVQMLGVVDEIDTDLLVARVKGDAAAVAEYTALRKFVKEAI